MSPTTPTNPAKRRSWVVLLVVVLAIGIAVVLTKSVSSSHEGFSDVQFAAKAAQGGLAEVQLGQLAAQKGQSEVVRKFGQRMAEEHAKANEELERAAAQQNIQLPNGLDQEARQSYDKLSKLSGSAFDRSYARDVVKDHQKDVTEFQREAADGKNEAVRMFAVDTLPTLQDHLRAAREVEDSVSDKDLAGMPTVPR